MAKLFCADIRKLFDIERDADKAELSPAERVACRRLCGSTLARRPFACCRSGIELLAGREFSSNS
jgi:hypothetical protein